MNRITAGDLVRAVESMQASHLTGYDIRCSRLLLVWREMAELRIAGNTR